jgi:hypothetical protein
MNYYIPFVLSLTLLAVACGEELTTDGVAVSTPIVESYLQEGGNLLTVKVYSMEAYLKDGYEQSNPLEGLQLKINGQELAETAAGTYSLDLKEDSICGLQTYDLSFEYDGKTVAASTSVPQKIDSLTVSPTSITRDASSSWYFGGADDTTEIRLAWNDPDKSYYQIYIESPASSDMPFMGGGMQFRRRMMQPFRGSSYVATSREFMSAGYYWIYVYRVNKDYVDLYERISATDLANPSSAIQNAFGIFTAMSVARVRFRVVEN